VSNEARNGAHVSLPAGPTPEQLAAAQAAWAGMLGGAEAVKVNAATQALQALEIAGMTFTPADLGTVAANLVAIGLTGVPAEVRADFVQAVMWQVNVFTQRLANPAPVPAVPAANPYVVLAGEDVVTPPADEMEEEVTEDRGTLHGDAAVILAKPDE
jgi:hypothetical protein